MKSLSLLVILSVSVAMAQESADAIMEKRAREFHRVIGLNDKEQWKKFVKENYTQALIDKPVKASRDGAPDSQTTASSSGDKLEDKAAIFKMLHDDFGGSEITGLRKNGLQIEMSLLAVSGLVGTFRFTYEKSSPYKIDGLAAEAGN